MDWNNTRRCLQCGNYVFAGRAWTVDWNNTRQTCSCSTVVCQPVYQHEIAPLLAKIADMEARLALIESQVDWGK